VRCKVFLGFTSNLISSGVRDVVRYLVEHNMVSNVGSLYVLYNQQVELFWSLGLRVIKGLEQYFFFFFYD